MTSHALVQLLPANVFAILVVFCRIGAAVMWLPGFGNGYVPVRSRVMVGLLTAIVVTPVLAPSLPPMPSGVASLTGIIGLELIIGSFLGAYANLLVSALEMAGGVIAMQSSLASAIVFNPGEQKSETLPAAMLAALAVVAIFATDLHHMMLAVIVDSYTRFPAGTPLPMSDLADAMARIVSTGFLIAMQIAAPYVILGTLFHATLGLIGRIMPQLQIFYVGLPLQILGGLALLLLTIPPSIIWFLARFEALYSGLTRGG
jgi:flagellar biosynthetic protein FliR